MNLQKLIDTQIDELDIATTMSAIREISLPPRLTGIEMQKGLKCMGGNKMLYGQLLLRFVDGQRHSLNKIRIALDMHNYDLASQLAHSLKGLAGNIGAMKLHSAAHSLEEALELQIIDPKLLNAVQQTLQEVTQAITEWESSLHIPSEEEAPDNIDFSLVMPLLYKLTYLIKENDTEVLDTLEKLNPLLRHSEIAAEMKSLEKAASHFDFEIALVHAENLTKALEKAHVEHQPPSTFPFKSLNTGNRGQVK